MRQRNRALTLIAAVCMAFTLRGWTQGQQAPAASASPSQASEPITTFKVATRMVTIDVVARDGKGNSFRDLKPDDFEASEQIEPKRDKYPQKIKAFRTTSVAELAAMDPGRPKMAPGVYTNLVTMNRVPVPPTIILLDALNTDRITMMQVRQQLVKMLSSIPDDVPTAVYLLGRRLEMLQSFTTDPKLLRATLEKIPAASQPTGPESAPSDPDAASMFPEQSALDRSPDSPDGYGSELSARYIFSSGVDTHSEHNRSGARNRSPCCGLSRAQEPVVGGFQFSYVVQSRRCYKRHSILVTRH